jgi:hypothetical protein
MVFWRLRNCSFINIISRAKNYWQSRRHNTESDSYKKIRCEVASGFTTIWHIKIAEQKNLHISKIMTDIFAKCAAYHWQRWHSHPNKVSILIRHGKQREFVILVTLREIRTLFSQRSDLPGASKSWIWQHSQYFSVSMAMNVRTCRVIWVYWYGSIRGLISGPSGGFQERIALHTRKTPAQNDKCLI